MYPTRRSLIAGTAALIAVYPARAQAPALPLLRAAEADIPLGAFGLEAPAFNGLAAGPQIEIRRGEAFTLKVENALDFAFEFRPQGLRGKAIQGNDTPVAPGETRGITITPPDAGTFMYRAGGTDAARTVLLSGPLVVTTEQPSMADREILLAVNTLVIPDADTAKPPRRVVTVNGAQNLKLTARPSERLRLRLVNLAQEAMGGVHVPDGAQVIAIDGQPCEPFPPFDSVMILPPLGRADIVFDIPHDATAPLNITDALDRSLSLASIAIEGEALPERYLARQLPGNTALPKEIPFTSATRPIWKAGEAAPDPLVRVKAGGSVILTFENSATPHALMLDGLTARLLDTMDDGWKGWWHDTLLIHANETARIAFIPSGPGRYALDLIPLEGDGAPARAWVEVS